VLVTNWHALTPETDPKRSVMRRGPESDAAFCRRIVEPKLGRKRRILVLNDEAHHAYRHKPGVAKRGKEAEEAERATVWVDGLARVHRDCEVLRCVDFSATPMYVPGSGHDPTRTHLTGVGAGAADEQTHEFMWQSYRRQKLLFDVAARIIRGQTELAALFRQTLAAVDRFVETKVVYATGVDERELDNELYKSMIANQLQAAIRPVVDGDGKLLPVLDQFQPEGSTTTVASSTAKPVEPTARSQVNYVACDSDLERQIARELEATSGSKPASRTTTCSARSPTDTRAARSGTSPTSSSGFRPAGAC